jgi:DNA-directed RNA polymerase specialized sigma24 family protein
MNVDPLTMTLSSAELLDDRMPLARARAGDPAAFEALYRRYHKRVLGLCRHMLRAPENAEDAAGRARRQSRLFSAALPDEPPAPSGSPLTLVLARERKKELERAVTELAPECRIPLVLRYYAELGYDEIAAGLGIEKTQVAGRIFRAKVMLRKALSGAVFKMPSRGES